MQIVVRPCANTKCKDQALSGDRFCWEHLEDRAAFKKRIVTAISEGQSFKGQNLQRVDFSNLQFEKANFEKANLSLSSFTDSHLFDAKLSGADLIGARLERSDLTHCSLKGADMTKADLSHARLWNSDLTDSNLTESNFSNADFWSAKLFNVKLWHTTFKDAISLTKRNFIEDASRLSCDARINESGLLSAEESYRDLKGYFLATGCYADASWAAFKEKTMERFTLKKKKDFNYIPSLIMNVLCGYGEKPYRIVLSAFGAIVFFASLYALLGAIKSTAPTAEALYWTDYLYFSTITFTTVGYGDFVPKAVPLFRLLAAMEAFMGVYLTGLFIFTLSRKYSAR